MARALKGAQASDPVGGSDGLLKFEGLVVASASSRKARVADGGSTELPDDTAPCAAGTEAGRGLLEASSLTGTGERERPEAAN